jgi:septum site-determining protein MinD
MIVGIYGKDGSGKTTITANLGIALAQADRRVLLIDADLENPALALALGLSDFAATIHEALAGRAGAKKAVHRVQWGVHLVPGDISIGGLVDINVQNLGSVVKELSEDYDITLIDCSGGIDQNASAAISSSDRVLLVSNPELTSISAALKMKMMADKLDLDVGGVVLNKVTEGEEVAGELVSEFLATEVISSIPFDPDFRRSLSYGRPLIISSPDSPASKALKNLRSRIMPP